MLGSVLYSVCAGLSVPFVCWADDVSVCTGLIVVFCVLGSLLYSVCLAHCCILRAGLIVVSCVLGSLLYPACWAHCCILRAGLIAVSCVLRDLFSECDHVSYRFIQYYAGLILYLIY